ncbi:helix-turn-helix domain-containing protein [Candidatus Pantoea deserta]|uniref:helix-turn-helix domain-containing protein n=1 Tax=Candidatus Pantoea deserta TaxID=1869313 RepID=UPI00131A0059|nr:helix-turn-helix domain-containing protein [Pantoea deserta]
MQKRIIEDLITWIDQNLDRKICLEEIAHRVGYSRWHLHRVFKAYTRQNLGSYIRNRRLEAAKKDLIAKNEPILDVCVKYGFESQQEFTRAFSRRYSMPPGAYRKQFRLSA